MKNIQIFWKRYGSTILSLFASAGVVGTAVLAVRNNEKAKTEIEEKDPETGKEELLIFAKNHVSTIAVGASTVFCIFESNNLSQNHRAALISAYELLNSSFSNYKRKVIEYHGPEEHKRILNAIAVEKVDPPHIYADTLLTSTSLESENITANEPKRLFYDAFSDRYFESTYGNVLQAQYHLNRNFSIGGVVMLNEYYEFIGLENTVEGNELGWCYGSNDGYVWIDFNNYIAYMEDGTEYIIIDMPFEPTMEWQESW